VAGRARCRMHGGAKSSGGPRGRRNGNYKHGRYTAEAMKRRLQLTQWIKGPIAPDQTLRVYDETIRVLKSAVRNAKLGREEISPQTSKQNQVVISEKPGFTHVSADAYLYVLRSTTRAPWRSSIGSPGTSSRPPQRRRRRSARRSHGPEARHVRREMLQHLES
jgi:hypothetical protein